MISDKLGIRNGDLHKIFNLNTNELINSAIDIQTGDNCLIGARSTLFKCTSIKDDSILRYVSIAISVFNKSNIIAGIPAKIFKNNISWKR